MSDSDVYTVFIKEGKANFNFKAYPWDVDTDEPFIDINFILSKNKPIFSYKGLNKEKIDFIYDTVEDFYNFINYIPNEYDWTYDKEYDQYNIRGDFIYLNKEKRINNTLYKKRVFDRPNIPYYGEELQKKYYFTGPEKKDFLEAKTHFQLKNKHYNYVLSLENNPDNKKGFTVSAINSLFILNPFSEINKDFILTKQDLRKISPTIKSKLLNSINHIDKNKYPRKKETPGLSNIININKELHTKLQTIASEMGLINTQLERNYFSSMTLDNQKKMLSKWIRTVLK